MRISDWSSDVCSSDLCAEVVHAHPRGCHNATTKAGEPGVAMVVGGTGLAGQVIAAEHHRGVAGTAAHHVAHQRARSEEHTSELQSLMRISYAVFCLKKKNKIKTGTSTTY